jgi:vacuolar-type H+-ATPase subunit I/STV1
MTAAERQQRKRDRQKAGLVRVECWVPSDKVDAVKRAIDDTVTGRSTPAVMRSEPV